jgi:hypothetical protein
LCNALVEAWRPALGAAVHDAYAADHRRWREAARTLLQRHTRERLDHALTYMVTDEILGSQAITMPGFAKVADQLIARHYARQQRNRLRSAPNAGGGERLGWEEAKRLLERAVARHGRDGRAHAVGELAQANELLAEFVDRVRWARLCEQPMQYVDRQYAEIWAELNEQANQQREEPAA